MMEGMHAKWQNSFENIKKEFEGNAMKLNQRIAELEKQKKALKR
jgi:hypothetical protein